MPWKTFKNERPNEGKKVLIWRFLNRNYKVAHYKKIGNHQPYWVGYNHNVVIADENDMWMEFEYVEKP